MVSLIPSANLSPGFQLSPIKAMELAASRIPGAISLAQGIPSFNTPQVIRDFVTERVREGACDKYSLTLGLSELREEIALDLEREGLRFDPDTEILITAGSIQGITAAMLASTQPGDEVLLPSPSYASYAGSVYLSRCTPRFFSLDEDRNFDFQVEQIKRALTRKTSVILYCSPNNPTGTLFSETHTRELLKLAQQHSLTVIIDEVYKDFYYTEDKHFTPVSVPEARPFIIRVCSFSKAFAMTGWRVGFLHADRSLVSSIVKFHDAMVTCAPVASQYAAIAALRYGAPYLQSFREEFRKRRDHTLMMLDDLSHVLDYQVPKAAYFVFPRIKDTVPLARNSHDLAYDILNKVKLAVVPGSAFGPSGESHLRITFGRNKESVEQGMNRLAEYFSRSTAHNGASTTVKRSERPHFATRTFAARFLGCASRIFLARTRPLIIGIAGTFGKTVIKRIVVEELSRHYRVQANILSYNTEIGLPLSILGLALPRSGGQVAILPAQALWRALAGRSQVDIMVLEYGIRNPTDAQALLRIAVPDWLIVSDIATSDPGFNCREVQSGIRMLAMQVAAERVLWTADDAWVEGLRADLKPELKLDYETGSEATNEPNLPAIGHSASIASCAARILSARLLGAKTAFPKVIQ